MSRHTDCFACRELGDVLRIGVVYDVGGIWMFSHFVYSWGDFFRQSPGYVYRVQAVKHGYGATVYLRGK